VATAGRRGGDRRDREQLELRKDPRDAVDDDVQTEARFDDFRRQPDADDRQVEPVQEVGQADFPNHLVIRVERSGGNLHA